MDSTIIRPANKGDLATLVDGNLHLASETEALTLQPELVTNGVAHLLAHPELGHYWIAERDGHTCGQCMITTEWSDWRCAPMWWFQSVYVWPEYRRQGVFAALHQHVLTAAQKSGVAELRLYVERDNQVAQRTYSKLGMTGGHYRVFEQSVGQD